ncbi:rhamnan synthesis F family protein [Microbacterium sp. P04]|uniref:rhamnan synthesis F family protein n=1 Tax=Microbacterium sp. P04 TaxID=3366947 RepID=UPI0037458FAC
MKTAELIGYPERDAVAYPEDGKRLLIYVIYNRRGDVEEYISHALLAMREHCDQILVMVNGLLGPAGRERLEPVSDHIIVRENRGYDIWAYKEGLDFMAERMPEFEEVLLVNDTWFGPIRPFAPVFERMDRKSLHFWGMTDHMRVEPNPFTQTGYLAYHLQSYWVAVRKGMFLSPEWSDYWRDLPEMNSYSDAVAKHEGVFTEHFTGLGFSGEVAFPTLTDQQENHSILYAEQLIDAGCPTLKRRPFFQWPVFMDHVGVIGRWTLDAVARTGYPVELIYQDLARNVEPRVLNADAAMLEVLSPAVSSYDSSAPLKTVVIAHIYYPEMTREILERADTLPAAYDLVVTTPDTTRAEQIRAALDEHEPRGSVEVRVVESNNGRDQAAFLIGCRDILLGGDYELVVKVHSKKTPQDGANIGRHFRRQQFDNLLPGQNETANLVAMFQREPGLGLAYPPTIHIGYPTMGHGWWANRPGFEEMRKELGVQVPMDEVSPLAPFGSMFFARPEALRLLAEHRWSYDDFGGAEAYKDGGLAHVLERMPTYAAGELGYHTRTVATPEYLSKSYPILDFNLDQAAKTLPDHTMHQIGFLRRAGDMGDGTLRDFVNMWVRLHRPGTEPKVDVLFERTQRIRGALWRARHPRSWLRAR